MEADQKQHEVQPPQGFAVHLSRHLGEPVVKGAEDRKEDSAHDYVVEMSDHEIRVPKLPIERRRAQHDSSQTRDQELKEKPEAKQHRRFEMNPSTPQGRQPVEDL